MLNFKPRKNITVIDYIHYLASYLFEPLKDFLHYRKTYKNFFHVIKQRRKKNYPISAILRNGKKVMIKNPYQVMMYKLQTENYCFFKDELLIIKKPPMPEIKLSGWEENGDVIEIFFENNYKVLPCKDKTVIDIGANIGDSSIYFAIKGANKVVALEPSILNYNLAEKNILFNNLTKKIDLSFAGCGGKTGIIITTSDGGGDLYSFENKDGGDLKVPILTLSEVIQKYNKDSLVLKIDCEGCEYDIINSSSIQTLQNFSHIIIEYHFGYLNLKKKLEECGFKITISKPKMGKKLTSENLITYVGILFAEKKN